MCQKVHFGVPGGGYARAPVLVNELCEHLTRVKGWISDPLV